MARIFISYRRDDSAGHAGRVYDRLSDHFGPDQVFMDVDTIAPGRDFVDAVQKAVGGCDGLVAIIGREWLAISDAAGVRRLEDPEDLVRLEIATALERGIRVIPVLVQGTQMPSNADLPEGLKELARRNAQEAEEEKARQAEIARLKQEAGEFQKALARRDALEAREEKAREAEMARLKKESEKADKARQAEIASLRRELEKARQAREAEAEAEKPMRDSRAYSSAAITRWSSASRNTATCRS